MLFATWNVNSVRARLPRVIQFLEGTRPDVVCLQETKCLDEVFPREPLEELGYNLAIFGQKTYNGVAVLSKRPIEPICRGFEDGGPDDEARVLGVTIDDFMLLDLYVVNGQEVGHPRYHFKLEWLDRVRRLLDARFPMKEKVIVAGDFNVTFDDRDVYDPEAWREKILCSTPEREALGRVMGAGLVDSFRKFEEEGGFYTWWDFRTSGFKRGQGLRIDHILLSDSAMDACTSVTIDLETRDGEKPSDHAPVLAEFE